MGAGRTFRGLLAIACMAVALSIAPRGAVADSVVTSGTPDRNYANLRIGSSSGDPEGHPSLCIEVSPLSIVSLEGCDLGLGGGKIDGAYA